MTGGGDKREETLDGMDTEGEEERTGDSTVRFREGEGGVGTNVSGLWTLVEEAGFRDLTPILGSKLSGRLDLGP